MVEKLMEKAEREERDRGPIAHPGSSQWYLMGGRDCKWDKRGSD